MWPIVKRFDREGCILYIVGIYTSPGKECITNVCFVVILFVRDCVIPTFHLLWSFLSTIVVVNCTNILLMNKE